MAAPRIPAIAVLVRLPRLSLLSIWLLTGLGCGNHLHWRDGRVQHRKLEFEIAHPGPEWSQLKIADRGTAAFEQRDGAVREVGGHCGRRHDIPLEVLRRHLMIGFRDVTMLEERRQRLAEREALYSHMRASLDGVPRELRMVVLKKDGCVFDLLEIGAPSATPAPRTVDIQAKAPVVPTQIPADNAGDFAAWLATFRVIRTPPLKEG